MSIAAQKAAKEYIKSIGLITEYHFNASVANIVYGHRQYHESCLRDMNTFLRLEGVKLNDDQVQKLIEVTRAAL